MTSLFVILNVVIMIALIFALYLMQSKRVSFSKRVFASLVLGLIFGFGLQYVYGPQSEIIATSTDWFNIVGTGYIRLLQMIVMPLIFISILMAFTKLKLSNHLGKISTLVIGILVGTTAIAAAIGIAAAVVFDLEAIQIEQGESEAQRGAQLEETHAEIEGQTLPQQIVALIPSNPFLDLTGARPTSTIAVVIFSIILGISYLGLKRNQPEHADLLLSIGQNGCAGIYPAMLAVMIAPTVGIDPLTPSFLLMLIVVVAISSFGVAGVGGGATFAAIIVLSVMDLPVALAGLMISIEPLIDMGRTAVNVSGSMTSGILTSKLTGDLDTNMYHDHNQTLEVQA